MLIVAMEYSRDGSTVVESSVKGVGAKDLAVKRKKAKNVENAAEKAKKLNSQGKENKDPYNVSFCF